MNDSVSWCPSDPHHGCAVAMLPGLLTASSWALRVLLMNGRMLPMGNTGWKTPHWPMPCGPFIAWHYSLTPLPSPLLPPPLHRHQICSTAESLSLPLPLLLLSPSQVCPPSLLALFSKDLNKHKQTNSGLRKQCEQMQMAECLSPCLAGEKQAILNVLWAELGPGAMRLTRC